MDKYYLIGLASGLAGVDVSAGFGPVALKKSSYLANSPIRYEWVDMINPPSQPENILAAVSALNTQLAKQVQQLAESKKPFSVLGGDHTSAIGTWSGVHAALKTKGDLGLIWIDAHMDSHTPQTSLSGRIHGMPLAVLLGQGKSELTSILDATPKLLPQNVCLIGVRSYEEGEAVLLKRLNVKIYFMDEVEKRGFSIVLREAVEYVSKNTAGYGISLDIDSLDPLEAPGVDVPEPNGIHVADLLTGLATVAADPHLVATEVVEFDPSRDKNDLTEKVVADVIETIAQARLSRGQHDKTGSEYR